MRLRLKEQAAYAKAMAEVNQRTEHYQTISKEYYADYQEAINREPTVVTERVLVRANCKTNAAADSSGAWEMEQSQSASNYTQKLLEGATAVTDQAERDVLSCRAALAQFAA